jgi:hypothetical protein
MSDASSGGMAEQLPDHRGYLRGQAEVACTAQWPWQHPGTEIEDSIQNCQWLKRAGSTRCTFQSTASFPTLCSHRANCQPTSRTGNSPNGLWGTRGYVNYTAFDFKLFVRYSSGSGIAPRKVTRWKSQRRIRARDQEPSQDTGDQYQRVSGWKIDSEGDSRRLRRGLDCTSAGCKQRSAANSKSRADAGKALYVLHL